MARPTIQQNTDNDMAFTATNYKLFLAGIGIIILGFLLMSGGGSGDPQSVPDNLPTGTAAAAMAGLLALASRFRRKRAE